MKATIKLKEYEKQRKAEVDERRHKAKEKQEKIVEVLEKNQIQEEE